MTPQAGPFLGARQTLDFAASDVIFSQGDPAEHMYVVIRGSVRIVRDGVDVATVEEGSLLGEMALVDSAPRSATAIAQTHCELAPITRAQFLYMTQETPYFALKVMRVMAERLRGRLGAASA